MACLKRKALQELCLFFKFFFSFLFATIFPPGVAMLGTDLLWRVGKLRVIAERSDP